MSERLGRRGPIWAVVLLAAVTASCGGPPAQVATSPAATTAPESTDTAAPADSDTSEAPRRVPARPGGQPPGVRHDIPRVGNNLTSQNDWVGAVRNRCREVGEKDDCLSFAYRVSATDDSGHSTRIPNPGPGYADGDEPRYDGCTVTDVEPPGGDRVTVPSGTTITVTIECHRREHAGTSSTTMSSQGQGG